MFTNLFTLGRDAELRFTQSGTQVADLALAYNYGQKGQDGKRPTQWIKAALWGKQAESLAPYLLKGSKILASLDDLHVQTYDKQDGTIGINLVAQVRAVQLAGSPQQAGQAQRQAAPAPAPAQRQQRAPAPAPAADIDDDSIPF